MKLTIEDGRDLFYTFDTNRILLLTATDEEQINQVEFSTEENGETVSWTSDVLTGEDGIKYVQVPNEFLNGDYSRLVCYYVALDSNGEFTRQKEIFRIRARQEPQDYYLTYSERVTFASIKALTEQYKVNASNSADLARRYAEESEDVNVETGTYSSKHWSAKSEKKFQEIKDYVGSASDPESALGSIESARASAVSDVEKQKSDSIKAVGTYTSNTAIPSVSQYVESTAKPALKTYGEQQVDSYVNGTSKPELDRYVETDKKNVLDNYTAEKKSELDNYTETDKKQVLDSYTENEKKTELNTHVEGLKGQLDSHTVAKTGELNEYTTGLKSELDGYTTAKEQDISEFTEQKKAEVQGVYQTDLNELKGDLSSFAINGTLTLALLSNSWVVGDCWTDTGNYKEGVTYRVCTQNKCDALQDDLNVYIKPNRRMFVLYFKSSGVYFSGWKTGEYTIEKGYEYKIVISGTSESDDTEKAIVADVNTFLSYVDMINPVWEKINHISKYIANICPPNDRRINITETTITIPSLTRIYYDSNKIYRLSGNVTVNRVSDTYSEEWLVFNSINQTFSCIGGNVGKLEDEQYFIATLESKLNGTSLPITYCTFNDKPYFAKSGEESDSTSITYLNNTVEFEQKLQQGRFSRGNNDCFGLIHFSDIHGSIENIRRITSFADKYSSYIDDIYHSGDTTSVYYESDNPFDTYGGSRILNTIGNHDCWKQGQTWPRPYSATAEEVYQKIFVGNNPSSPFISGWNVVSAGTNLCYYYKDYTSRGIRLIVLDSIHYDEYQEAWLASTLDSAKASGLSVICSSHYPAQSGVVPIDCTFTSKNSVLNAESTPSGTDQFERLFDSAFNVVDNFISSGGDFVCWLVGHSHFDYIGTVRNHSNQLHISVNCAITSDTYGDEKRTINTKTQDCFNVVFVDKNKKFVKLVRVGCNIDETMRKKELLCISYSTKELISNY